MFIRTVSNEQRGHIRLLFILVLVGVIALQTGIAQSAAAATEESLGSDGTRASDLGDGSHSGLNSFVTDVGGTQNYSNDGHEPNDNLENATSISTGSYSNLQIADGESDYFAVTAEAGETLEASIYFSSSIGDLDLELYGPDFGVVDRNTSQSDLHYVSIREVPENATYYIRVFGVTGDSAPYDLEVAVSEPSGVSTERYEPNNELALAASIYEGTHTDLQVVNGESDYYSVTADAGDTVEASIDFAQSTGDLHMELYGPGGQRLDTSVSSWGGESVSARDLTQSGTYYIHVYGTTEASVTYDLTVDIDEFSGISNGRDEPNDDFENATFIPSGTYSDLQLDAGDSDFFRVFLEEGASLEATIDFANRDSDLDMALYGPDREEIDVSYSVSDRESVSVRNFDQEGTYYLKIYGYFEYNGSYDLEVTVEEPAVPGQIEVSVLGSNGVPVSGARVRVRYRGEPVVVSDRTDASGNASVEVQPGLYTVVATFDGEETPSSAVRVYESSTETVELVFENVEGQPTDTSEEDSDLFGPGFGLSVAMIALLSVALLGWRRFVG